MDQDYLNFQNALRQALEQQRKLGKSLKQGLRAVFRDDPEPASLLLRQYAAQIPEGSPRLRLIAQVLADMEEYTTLLKLARDLRQDSKSVAELADALVATYKKLFGSLPPILELGKAILDEQVYPETSREDMECLLTASGYAEEDIRRALDQLYPRRESLGVVLMLDVSGSMSGVIGQVRTNAAAFVRLCESGDQFGVNQFESKASLVYPERAAMATVSASLAETKAAAEHIERLHTGDLTNMGEAVRLANTMIESCTADIRAFVMLSDSAWNEGANPADILGQTPPIYIGGLGPGVSRDKFKTLLAKNNRSSYYHMPDENQMMKMFNAIKSQATGAALTLNDFDPYPAGTGERIKEFTVSENPNRAQVCVVWTDGKYRYSPGTPTENEINVVLVDPQGKDTDIKPSVADPGYCIFNLRNVMPGLWKLRVRFQCAEKHGATCGAFEFNSGLSLDLALPGSVRAGDSIPVDILVREKGASLNAPNASDASGDSPVELRSAKVVISSPALPLKKTLAAYAAEINNINLKEGPRDSAHPDTDPSLARLLRLREQKLPEIDILEYKHAFHSANMTAGGAGRVVVDMADAGLYQAEVTVEGIHPVTGVPFRRIAVRSFEVE